MSDLRILSDAHIPELPNRYNGKVRENYDLPDGSRIIIATDRLSAFDVILTSIPFKGQVLTQTARYWFEETADICPNHVLSYPDPNVVIGTRLDILPVEIVVRGYLAGTTSTSILTKYRKGEREMYGITLPDGMKDNEKLPEPIITPTSKAFDGGHDEPLSGDEILAQGLLTAEQWETVSRYALALFARGQARAAERGLILVDTKYEFGTDKDGRIVLADEIHPPDSSRYWIAGRAVARQASTRISCAPGSLSVATPTRTRSRKFRANSSSRPRRFTSRPLNRLPERLSCPTFPAIRSSTGSARTSSLISPDRRQSRSRS